MKYITYKIKIMIIYFGLDSLIYNKVFFKKFKKINKVILGILNF